MESKYTKFRRNTENYGDKKLWSYTALDETDNSSLIIKLNLAFRSSLPCEILSGSRDQFDLVYLKDILSEEITAKEFWAAYKLYVTRLYKHMMTHNPDVSESV